MAEKPGFDASIMYTAVPATRAMANAPMARNTMRAPPDIGSESALRLASAIITIAAKTVAITNAGSVVIPREPMNAARMGTPIPPYTNGVEN